MAGPEATVERRFNDIAKQLGWRPIKMRPFESGWPDRGYLRWGAGRPEVRFIEWKRVGKEPTPQQARRIAELNTRGYRTIWSDNIDTARAFLAN